MDQVNVSGADVRAYVVHSNVNVAGDASYHSAIQGSYFTDTAGRNTQT